MAVQKFSCMGVGLPWSPDHSMVLGEDNNRETQLMRQLIRLPKRQGHPSQVAPRRLDPTSLNHSTQTPCELINCKNWIFYLYKGHQPIRGVKHLSLNPLHFGSLRDRRFYAQGQPILQLDSSLWPHGGQCHFTYRENFPWEGREGNELPAIESLICARHLYLLYAQHSRCSINN